MAFCGILRCRYVGWAMTLLSMSLAPSAAPAAQVACAALVGNQSGTQGAEAFCDVIDALRAGSELTGNGSPRIDVGAIGADGSIEDRTRFRDGDILRIDVTATPLFDGFLHVAYITADGLAVHLTPTKDSTGTPAAAGETLRLGGDGTDPDVPAFMIAPPFGVDMIVVISSPFALFDQPRAAYEPVDVYAAALGSALASGSGERPLLSSFTFVVSGP